MKSTELARFVPGTLVILSLLTSGMQVLAQGPEGSLTADTSAVQAEIRKAEEEDQRFTGGLIKSLISLRLATLRQTLALLDQRAKAAAARTTLHYTVDGKTLALPADASQQLAAVENELADNALKLSKQEAEAARYSGGLVQATALAAVATLRQTQAMLDQKRLALKYGFLQFVGFKDLLPVPGAASPPQPSPAPQAAAGASSATPQIPADCMKLVFGSFCLGAPASSLPSGPARKTDDIWAYLEPQPTIVTLVDGRVASVGKLYSPGTWLTYRNVESDLLEKYGQGKDLSFFPSYANDSDSKETAINLKKGRATRSWQQQGYTIQLKWENRENVVLVYFHDELEAKRTTKKKDQY